MPRVNGWMGVLAAAGLATTAGPAPLHAQVLAPTGCVERLVSYEVPLPALTANPVLLLQHPGAGSLTYLGALHLSDSLHPQFRAIENAWTRARPTVAYYEGPARPVAATAGETIARYGESGFVRWLATRDGVRIARLEPSPQAEAAAVLERFPLEQVGLFYILREAARLRDRQGVAGAALTEAVETLIARMAAMEGLPVAFRTRTEFEEAYRRAFEAPADWREVPTEWFAPTPGPRFTQAINRASSGFRNLHMVEVLSTDVLRGERVFAVVGRDHLPRQEPALRCAIEGAGSGER